jgi:hypothetical protein
MGRNVPRQPNNHKISNRMTNIQMPTRAMVFPFGSTGADSLWMVS